MPWGFSLLTSNYSPKQNIALVTHIAGHLLDMISVSWLIAVRFPDRWICKWILEYCFPSACVWTDSGILWEPFGTDVEILFRDHFGTILVAPANVSYLRSHDTLKHFWCMHNPQFWTTNLGGTMFAWTADLGWRQRVRALPWGLFRAISYSKSKFLVFVARMIAWNITFVAKPIHNTNEPCQLPWRLEWCISALAVGSHGSWNRSL